MITEDLRHGLKNVAFGGVPACSSRFGGILRRSGHLNLPSWPLIRADLPVLF